MIISGELPTGLEDYLFPLWYQICYHDTYPISLLALNCKNKSSGSSQIVIKDQEAGQ
jgi:hypothetical protein